MKKDTIEELFNNLKGSFDIHETPSGHKERFLDKLIEAEKPSVIKLNWWKPLSIAASIAVLIAVGSTFLNTNPSELDLASVSPEMMQTQSFFTSTINKELQTLKSLTSPEAKILVDDALKQIDILEKEYAGLKKDLVVSGNDKRVIYAMISNFQNRIDLLQQVIEKIEEIKNLKTNRDETTI
tara:strand:+ start:453 stop:998 length:546 start_codon:yes stop_codon:yes gene_type:complete